MILDHKTIEAALEATGKEAPSQDWLGKLGAIRECFRRHEVVSAADCDVSMKDPDYDGLTKFLVEGHQFDETRVDKYITRLKAARAKKPQSRMDQFFTLAPREVKAKDKFDPKKKKASAKAKAKAGAKKVDQEVGSASGPERVTLSTTVRYWAVHSFSRGALLHSASSSGCRTGPALRCSRALLGEYGEAAAPLAFSVPRSSPPLAVGSFFT